MKRFSRKPVRVGAGALARNPLEPAVRRNMVLWGTWLALLICLVAARCIHLAWNWDLLHAFSRSKLLEAFAIGLRFDVSAAAFLCAALLPLTLIDLSPGWSRWRWNLYAWMLLAVTLPLLVLQVADSELVRAVGRRMSVDGLFLLGESNWRVTGIARQFAPLVLAGLALASAWVLFVVRARKWILTAEANTESARTSLLHRAAWAGGLLVLSVALLTIAIRGGLTNNKPLSLIHTHPEPQLGNLALNTPFVLIKTIASNKLARLDYFGSRDALLAQLNGAAGPASLVSGKPGRRPPPNVVVLVMESLSLGYMGEVNGVKGYTPFLDELTHSALFLPNTWANAMRSIDGIPAVLASVPALGTEPLLASPYAATAFEGLGTLLTRQGYDSAFFHAAQRGSMYFDRFAPRAGFAHYYARDDYPDPNDDDGAWGIFDEPYLQYVVDRIDRMRRPFGVAVFSLTAHHPFKVPPHLADRLPDGPQPILKAIAYSDYALRRFFETARTRPWFKDTLFVITADHGFLPYLPQYENDLGRWRVPLILYQPGRRNWPAVDTRQPVAQVDIGPTIADLIGAPAGERNWLARSVFAPGERTVVLRAENNLFAVGADYFLFYPLQGGEPQLYSISDPGRRNPLTGHDDRRQELISRTQASLQYFNNGLLDGTLLQPDLSRWSRKHAFGDAIR